MDGIVLSEKEYFRIGEVSKLVGVEPYVIRFWEAAFKSVKPVRTRSSQRIYSRKDIEKLLVIKNLLYVEQFTIQGAKRQLKQDSRLPAQVFPGESQRLTEVKRELLALKRMMGG
jgi:DNA-binding transcriptional MerR regulator